MDNKIYYLETNALYALCNHFSEIIASGIDVTEIKKCNDVIEKENKKKITDVIVSDRKRIEKLRKEQRENPTYIEMDVEKIFGMKDEANLDREANRNIECPTPNGVSFNNTELIIKSANPHLWRNAICMIEC